MGGAEASSDRFIHRSIWIALGAMKRSVAKRSRYRLGHVAEHDDHLIADGANCVVGCSDERLGTFGTWPLSDLLLAAHPPATSRSQDHADAAITTCVGHWAS